MSNGGSAFVEVLVRNTPMPVPSIAPTPRPPIANRLPQTGLDFDTLVFAGVASLFVGILLLLLVKGYLTSPAPASPATLETPNA